MVSYQSFRSLLACAMITNLCIQRLSLELLLMVSALLSPNLVPETAIALQSVSASNSRCIDETMVIMRAQPGFASRIA